MKKQYTILQQYLHYYKTSPDKNLIIASLIWECLFFISECGEGRYNNLSPIDIIKRSDDTFFQFATEVNKKYNEDIDPELFRKLLVEKNPGPGLGMVFDSFGWDYDKCVYEVNVNPVFKSYEQLV